MFEMVKTKAKYIHLIGHNEPKFSSRVVKFINDPSTGIDSGEHLFVVPFKEVYEIVKEYDNVILDTESPFLVNKYAPQCKWLICHGEHKVWDLYKIKNRYLGKVIYRYWGGGFGFRYKKGKLLSNFVKLFLNLERTRKFNKFAAIGIAKNVDIMNMRGKIKHNRFYYMPYTDISSEGILEKVRGKGYTGDGIINVGLYHRGTEDGNHIEILEKLSRFGDKIRIYVPLSYGNKAYTEKVKAYIKENRKYNVIVVDEFMEYEEYVSLINRMDIGIFDCTTSTALGNVAVYLFLKKKMFLNRDGVIKKAFDEENIPHRIVDELDTISFEEFIKEAEYPDGVHYDLMPMGKTRAIEAWKKIIKDFN